MLRKVCFKFNQNLATSSTNNSKMCFFYTPEFYTSKESFRIFQNEKIRIKLIRCNKLFKYSSPNNKKYSHKKLELEIYNSSSTHFVKVLFGATLKELLCTPFIWNVLIFSKKKKKKQL